MRSIPLVAVFWFFALAVPSTIIALAGVAYIDLNFSRIMQSLVELERATTAGGRGWVAESGQRLPELAGMVIGAVVMCAIYLLTRKPAEVQLQTPR